MINDFETWLNKNAKLSESSAYKYSHAVKTVSNEMLSERVIDKPLTEMEIYELELAIDLIFHTYSFIVKDNVGNQMYSNALKRYLYCKLFGRW